MTIKQDDWAGCYPSKWKGVIVPEAMAHPAKFSSKLIRRIYQHMIDEGWLKAGDIVIDPFGGVALGALDAMRLGLRWRGVELEPRFAELGSKNIALWNSRYATMPHWCKDAALLQGDSRQLLKILTGDGSVTSPPYETGGHHDHQMDAWNTNGGGQYDRDHSGFGAGDKMGAVASPPYAGSMNQSEGAMDAEARLRRMEAAGIDTSVKSNIGGPHGGVNTPGAYSGSVASPPYSEARIGQQSGQEHAGRGDQYGPTPGQLGAMKAEDFHAAIVSPPYAETRFDGGMGMKEPGVGGIAPYSGERPNASAAQRNQANLGNLKAQGLDAALSSPPFRQASGGSPEPKPGGAIDAALYKRHAAGNSAAEGYGATNGQLANMPEGDFDASVNSPPYRTATEGQGLAVNRPATFRGVLKDGSLAVGHTEGQMADMPEGDHEAAISSPPYQASEVATTNKSQSSIENRKKMRADGTWQGYNPNNEANLGNDAGEDFWFAARTIVEQVYLALRPGAHAVWVLKGFVKDKKLVDFPGQWGQLCEAVGFMTVHEHHALLINHKGTSHTLDGGTVEHKTEAKSFFRRLAESNGSPKIDYETILCMEKPA